MSPIYEEEGKLTREELYELRRYNKCKECGARLDVFMDIDTGKAYLACADYRRTGHEGIEREASRYEKGGLSELTINTRRELMEEDYGEAKTKALTKYMGVVSLTKPQAKEILVSVYPDAPESEITRAVILCASYGLNPLMKHVFLIPFKRKEKGIVVGEDWVTVMGIKAKRLLASRRGPYSYIDDTPRVMTEQEQRTIFGEVEADKLWVITKGKDPQTGAEAVGYGFWPKDEEPHGTNKGNTKFNMAAIRSESQFLDRLRPGEMPEGIEVVPEEAAGAVIEGEFKEVTEAPPPAPAIDPDNPPDHLKEHWCQEHDCAFELKTSKFGAFYAHKKPEGGWCNEKKKKEPAPKAAPHIPENIEDLPFGKPVEEVKGFIQMDWLEESLKTLQAKKLESWSESNLLSYMKTTYKIEAKTVLEGATKLDKGQATHFVKKVQETLEIL